MAEQVKPNFGAAPKGKASIMRQGQTQVDAWGQDPYVKSKIAEPKDLPEL